MSPEVVYVLDAFVKKSKSGIKTPQADKDRVRDRFASQSSMRRDTSSACREGEHVRSETVVNVRAKRASIVGSP